MLFMMMVMKLLMVANFCFQGDSEFIGRAFARPVVKLASEKYDKPHFPPALEWFEIQRGDEKAGELLAAFELLHVSMYLVVLTLRLGGWN